MLPTIKVEINTPNVDRLAAEGIRFSQFYSGSPVCAPSRCVLLTGKHSGHAFVRDNKPEQPEGQLAIPEDERTIAEILKSEGYIRNFKIISDGRHKTLRIFLKYDQEGDAVISGLKRISKPSCRIYRGCADIPKVLNGYGVNILSTSKGLLTDREARSLNIGGEVICSLW